MTLIRTSALNGAAVAIRMGTALLLNKILAVYVGPAGYAVIGQFQNLISMANTFATAATGTGVTKFTAQFFDSEHEQRAVWRTAAIMTLGATLATAIVLIFSRHWLAQELLHSEDFSSIFLWLAAGLFFLSFNALLLSILNGRKEVRRYVVSNIAGSILGLCLTGALAYTNGLYGALIALSINQAVVIIVTLQQISTTSWFRWTDLFGPFSVTHFRGLLGFVAMAGTTAVVTPISHIAIRNYLGQEFGLDYAGFWDAVNRISTIYLSFITATLTLYYLPRLAEIRLADELRTEILKTFSIVVPASAVLSAAIFLSRDMIISVLFTDQFAPMRQLFAWQTAGDVVKIASWVISFVMLGRGMVKTFIVTETLFAIALWMLTVALTGIMGFEGASAAYLISYILYLGAMWYIVLVRYSGSQTRLSNV
ncbi:O-antigen translocase [Erythrobacteraceae bacterium CFH 75059]|uniref:O-antigen translocase n=1 Tax=Qipengyuania thermophila TaxID=2509361 RepID=UPI00101FE456|nr:O-antigen translocase [Qipengyuania thermophila]TCD04325.1 O-antigen translocase [Erythrobacteraceae bacterium CFH 75059]